MSKYHDVELYDTKNRRIITMKFIRILYTDTLYDYILKNGHYQLITERDIDAHLEAGTWKLPHGYQTPLWKVLNGENI